jgi:hypothetical protein
MSPHRPHGAFLWDLTMAEPSNHGTSAWSLPAGPHCGSFQWRNIPLAEPSSDGASLRNLPAEPSRGTLQWRGIPITEPPWGTFLRDHSWGCFQWRNLPMVEPSSGGTSLRNLPAEPALGTFQWRNLPLPPQPPTPTNRGVTCVLRARAPQHRL